MSMTIAPTQTREDAATKDVLFVQLFCAWIYFQSLYYQALPWLRVDLGFTVTPDRLILGALLLAFVARLYHRPARREPFTARALGWTLSIFAVWVVTSCLLSGADARYTKFAELTHALNMGAYPALAYAIARRMRFTPALVKAQLWFFAAFGLYLSVTAFAEHYELRALVWPKYILDSSVGGHFGRSRGPYVDTIANGSMLVTAFLSSSMLFVASTGAARVAAAVVALAAVPAVYFTDTRGVWLALAAVVVTLAMLRTAMRRVAASVIIVLATAFVVGVGSKFSASEESLFSRRQHTTDYRLDNFEIAWNAFKANPVFGLGYGKFTQEWRDYFVARDSRLGEGMESGNHSTILGLLADLGVVGTTPFVMLVLFSALLGWTGYRSFASGLQDFERGVSVMAISAIAIFVVLSLTNDLKAFPSLNVITFWTLGMLSSILATSNAPPERTCRAAPSAPRSFPARRRTAVIPVGYGALSRWRLVEQRRRNSVRS